MNVQRTIQLTRAANVAMECGITVCADWDSDCEEVPNHHACWLYDNERGMCPYLAIESGLLPQEGSGS